MTVRSLHDRLIVSRINEGEQKVGRVIIRTPPRKSRILFGRYSGQDIKLDGEEFLIMREDEVLAVLEDGVAQQPK